MDILGRFALLRQYPGVLLLVIIWSLYWKGRALWKAAKLDDRWWFIGILVVNTLGIIEILYLYYFSGDEE